MVYQLLAKNIIESFDFSSKKDDYLENIDKVT